MKPGCRSNNSRSILIAANPKSGTGTQGHLTQQLKLALEYRGFSVDLITCLDQLKQEAARLASSHRLEAVVAAGGDGTVSLLANLLPATVPLAIFPLGTENLLAKHWGITNCIETACNTILGGRIVHMDVGSANGKLFLVMLSCGFDADVVRRMHASRHGHIHRGMYAVPILRSLFGYRFPSMRCSPVEKTEMVDKPPAWSLSVPWLFLFNVPRYAASLQICPQADPTDGRLDLCTFQGGGILSGFFYLWNTWRGTHERLKEFQHTLVRSLSILPPSDSLEQPVDVPFQIDGDPGGVLPLSVEILPGRLKLLVPESTATADPVTSMPLASVT